jgi:hypothetical protein
MKSIKFLLCIAIVAAPYSALADAYKCMKAGRPTYQAAPCEVDSEKGKLDIKFETPEEKAMAEEKLEALREEYTAGKDAQGQATRPIQPQGTPPRPMQAQPQTPSQRNMYTYGNPLNKPADPNNPTDTQQPVNIIYPWGNPKYIPPATQ